MHGTRRPFVVSFALTLLVVSVVGVAFGVDEVEQELDDATRSLERIEAALARAEEDIIAAEQRLRDAGDALAAVEEELAAAEQAQADAELQRELRTAELEGATADLEDAESRYHAATGQLQDRTVEVYKYGTGRPQQALVTGLMGANDWHEVAVTTSTVSRIVQSDQELLREADSARRDADRARSIAAQAEVAAVVAEEQAQLRGEALRTVVEQHEAAVAAVEQEHAHREQVLAELEEDGELAAMLVATLENELARALEKQAAQRAAEEAAAAERAAAEQDAAEHAAAERAAGEQEASEASEQDPSDDNSGPDGPAEPEPGNATPPWETRLPAAGQPWAADIDAAASANGVDGRLFAALVWTESHFDPAAQSRVGAIGLAQLMPLTAASLGVDPWDPIQNLDGGARYLANQHQRFGQLDLALAAYNAGPTAVLAAGPGIPDYLETQLYVVRVLERYNHLAG